MGVRRAVTGSANLPAPRTIAVVDVGQALGEVGLAEQPPERRKCTLPATIRPAHPARICHLFST